MKADHRMTVIGQWHCLAIKCQAGARRDAHHHQAAFDGAAGNPGNAGRRVGKARLLRAGGQLEKQGNTGQGGRERAWNHHLSTLTLDGIFGTSKRVRDGARDPISTPGPDSHRDIIIRPVWRRAGLAGRKQV